MVLKRTRNIYGKFVTKNRLTNREFFHCSAYGAILSNLLILLQNHRHIFVSFGKILNFIKLRRVPNRSVGVI